MNKLIKEEILRISELMKIQVLNESEYNVCERFLENKQKLLVCKRINSLKSWIHKDDGLGLKKIINDKIQSLETEIPEATKQHFIDGANLLQSLGKITEKHKEHFIKNIVQSRKLVYLNGEWQPINKLNTNYADLAELLTDLIYKGGDKSKKIIQNIISNPKEGLKEIKPFLSRLLDKYFEDPTLLQDYTRNIQKRTSIGENAENKVKNTLKEMGFKSEYDGGNGDLIDMVFGTDLIMSSQDNGTKTIQVKDSEKAWDRSEDYPYVDWVVIANPFTIYDNRTKEEIKL